MLSSIYVENYKNLRKLQIDNLGRINLISGKNNTGKSSLLEAIYLYANEGKIESVVQVLQDRGELAYRRRPESEKQISEQNIKALSSLFFNRKISFDPKDQIVVEDLKNKNYLRIRFIDSRSLKAREQNTLFDNFEGTLFDDGDKTSFFLTEYSKKENQILFALDKDIAYYSLDISLNNNQFIHTNNIFRVENSKLFDAIALTNKEKSIIEALKIIESRTERIAFVEGRSRRDRSAVIKLADSEEIIPLSSMGDGINRILTIILALINSSGGYLLIDEFENGLHYSVQEQLWKIIFKLSVELDIQVFATTHSNDCISSFNQILGEQKDTSLGKYIRLDNIDGEIKEVVFSSKELNIAEQQDIELR